MDLGQLWAQDLMKPGHLGRNVVDVWPNSHSSHLQILKTTWRPLEPSALGSVVFLVHCDADGEGRRARATRDVRASFGRAAPATVSLRLLGFFLRSSGEGGVGVLLRQSEAGAPFRRRCGHVGARGRAALGCGTPRSCAPWPTFCPLSRFVQSLLVVRCANLHVGLLLSRVLAG